MQFSDLHIGTLVRPEREMNRLVDTINALQPDLVVFSGDPFHYLTRATAVFIDGRRVE